MLKIVLSVVLSFLAMSLSAQEPLDNTAYYRAEYTYRYKKDSTRKSYFKDTYYLDICKSGHSIFYSRANQYRDSVSAALLANGEHWMDVAEKIRSIPRGLAWSVDKRFAEGKYHYTNKLMIRFFRAIEPLEMPQWDLTKDTLTISGYLCYKATARAGGRDWEAWYTPQIPVNDGPWLLWGLPGLIIHAQDSNKYFTFRCTNVGQLPQPYEILLPENDKEIKNMDIKGLIKAEVLAGTDFIKFEEAYLGAKATTSSPPPKQYYIPLFLIK